MMTRKSPPPTGPGRKTSEGGRKLAAETPARKARALQEQLEHLRFRPGGDRYVLRLYVAGLAPRSAEVIERVREICEEHLKGGYELEVIDIYQLPALAQGEQIVATPTLIRVLPAPLRRYIGGLSKEKIVFGLDLRGKRQ
jgi:circadian clock protein KaiB